jgi:hypothetical protein
MDDATAPLNYSDVHESIREIPESPDARRELIADVAAT